MEPDEEDDDEEKQEEGDKAVEDGKAVEDDKKSKVKEIKGDKDKSEADNLAVSVGDFSVVVLCLVGWLHLTECLVVYRWP